MVNKEFVRDGFVFYATAWKNVLEFMESDPKLGEDLLKAIINYGFYKEYDQSNPIIRGAMANIILSIDNAANRHASAVAGGEKTASKTKADRVKIKALLQEGHTHKEIAEIMGCSVKTIQRAKNEFLKEESGQDKVDNCPQEFRF